MKAFHLRPVPALLDDQEHPGWGTSTIKRGCRAYLNDDGNEAEARRLAKAKFDRSAKMSPWLDPELITCRSITLQGDQPTHLQDTVQPDD